MQMIAAVDFGLDPTCHIYSYPSLEEIKSIPRMVFLFVFNFLNRYLRARNHEAMHLKGRKTYAFGFRVSQLRDPMLELRDLPTVKPILNILNNFFVD
jgi:hypothetical protein